MTTTEPRDLEPIRRRDDLLAPFAEACKPRQAWRIGPEVEKPGIFDGTSPRLTTPPSADVPSASHERGRNSEATYAPIPYEGERSILRIFELLASEHGWRVEREQDDGPPVALLRGDASVTLEPGGQLELSGKKSETIHEVCAELRGHMREIGPLSRDMGVRWLGIGFHPFARREAFPWVPKLRYGVMRDYLPTRGAHALDMMLRTSTVQANFDYESETDAMRKMRVALALAPATTAMFANSPWKEGRPAGCLSYRGRVWLDVDPDRSGLLPALWKKDARFDDYIDWALDVPMFLFVRDGRKIANTGQTFRRFWLDGFAGHRPTMADWKTHLNTLFPEVRLKKTIEVRSADAQSTEMKCALPALWTGILYDSRAMDEAEQLVAGWTHDEVAHLRKSAWRDGLRADFRGAPLARVAERMIAISEGGLERRARVDVRSGKDERTHLARLRKLVGEGKTPADVLLEGMEKEKDVARAMLERSTLTWE